MSIEQLLIPRYRVIADYPCSEFLVGDIFIFDDSESYDNLYDSKNGVFINTVEKYPHLFKKLEWWEERKISELPKHIAWYDPSDKAELLPKYFEVLAWGTSPNKANILRCHTKDAYFFISDCKPATEEEYLQSKQTKP
jgi:hypothetical protein